MWKKKKRAGTARKVPVFGLLKRGGKVYAEILQNTKAKSLMPIIQQKIQPQSIVYTDSYGSYNALDTSDFKHYRINHSTDFVIEHTHING